MIGSVVSHYEIIERIGSGGMGVVYRAKDSVLGRDVALKFLPLELSHDEEANARFMQEAKSASALEHPNICSIFEVGRADDGRLFIAMPLYQGATLRDLINASPTGIDSAGSSQPVMKVEQAIEIVRQIAEGLSAAYEKGIVHRDIKPANIMVTDAGRVIILDFGLAKLPGTLNLTRTGSTLGTAAYMSPEQISGTDVDIRTDLWSLGVVLYQLLTGRRPFDADYEQALTYAVVNLEPQAIPDLPPTVAGVIDRLLSKHPDDRFPSPRALIDALPAPGFQEQHAAPMGEERARTPIVLGIAAVAVLMLVVALLVLPESQDQMPDPDMSAIAVAPFVVSGNPDLEYLGEGLVDLLSLRLDGTAGFRAVDPNAVIGTIQKDGLAMSTPDDVVDLAKRLDAAHSVLGRVIEVGGSIQITATIYDHEAQRLVDVRSSAVDETGIMAAVDDVAVQILSAVAGLESDAIVLAGLETTDSFDAVKAYIEGERLIRRGKFSEAAEEMRRAVAADSNFALAWLRLGYASGWGVSLEGEFEGLTKAYDKRASLPPRLRRTTEAIYHGFVEGKLDLAKDELRQVLSVYPDDLLSLNELGELLFHSNPFDGRPVAESWDYFERALKLAPDHGDNMVHLIDLANEETNAQMIDSLERAFLALDSLSPTAAGVKAFRSLRVRPEGVGAEAAGDLSLLGGPVPAWNLLVKVATAMEDLALTRELTHRIRNELELPDNSDKFFVFTTEMLDVAEGRYDRFKTSIATNRDMYASGRLITSAILRTLPGYPASRSDLIEIQERLAAWDTTSQPAMFYIFDSLKGDYEPTIVYLRALIALRLDDKDGLAGYRAALGKIVGESDRSDFARALLRTLDAVESYRDGDLETALAALDDARLQLPWRVRARSDVHSQILNTYLRAEVLAGMGQTRQAVQIFESMRAVSFRLGIPLYGLIYLRTGQIYEALGRMDDAMDRYARVAKLWAEADPEFVPLRRLAEDGLHRLALNAIREPS